MISISKSPDALMLSNNTIPVEVLSSDSSGELVVQLGGVRSRLISNLGQGLTAGTIVTVNWSTPQGGSFSVNFSTDGTAASAYAIPAYSSGSLMAYWSSVAQAMGSSAEIAPWFTVFSEMNADGTYSVWFVVRDADPNWQLTFGPGGSTEFTTETNLLPATNEQYIVRCEVVIDPGTGFEVAGTAGCSPNELSRVNFDISGIVHRAILRALPYPGIPSWNLATPFSAGNVKPYYLRLWEFSEAEGFESVKFIRDLEAFAGGVSEVLAADGNFLTSFSTAGIWLNWRPDRRYVGPSEPVFMASLRRQFDDPFTDQPYLEVEQTNSQGVASTANKYENTVTIEGNNAVVWPVGPAQLGIAFDTLFYRVRVRQLRGSGSPLSLTPWQTFFVDRTEYESVRYLAYLNGFLLPEVVRCTGSVSSTLSASFQTNEIVRPQSAGVEIPDRENFATDTTNRYVFATGYKQQSEVETILEEIVRSPRVYEITPTGYTPLVLQSKSFPIDDTDRNLHSAILQFDLALRSKSYSRRDDALRVPPLDTWQSPDGSDWQSPDETPWSN
ncbi:MAG: hypothetical protein AAF828_01510 [Bacteroidota bacterium]